MSIYKLCKIFFLNLHFELYREIYKSLSNDNTKNVHQWNFLFAAETCITGSSDLLQFCKNVFYNWCTWCFSLLFFVFNQFLMKIIFLFCSIRRNKLRSKILGKDMCLLFVRQHAHMCVWLKTLDNILVRF